MERYVSGPNVDKSIVNRVQVYEGGTNATSVPGAQVNLDILPVGMKGVPNGLAVIPKGGLFGSSFQGGAKDTPAVDGPPYVKTNQTNKFFITNYDIKTSYDVHSSMGTITRKADYLFFESGPDVGTAKITVNDLVFDLEIFPAVIVAPTITFPVSGANDVNSKVTFKASGFATEEIGTEHASSDWELSTVVDFASTVKALQKSSDQLTEWRVEGLLENITYYVRVRYRDSNGNVSGWSLVNQVKTRESFAPVKPVILTPENGAKEQRADVTFTASPFFNYESDYTHVNSDWELSTSSVFAGTFTVSTANEIELTTWSVGALDTKTTYYVRVRYKDSRGKYSDWSDPSRFTTKDSFAADKPTILTPTNNTLDLFSSVSITSSQFKGGDHRAVHQSTDWELSTDTSFAYPVQSSYSDANNPVEWTPTKLSPLTVYYVRARYRDTMNFVTEWSVPVKFTTKESFAPGRPTITDPVKGFSDGGPAIDIRSSVYTSNDDGDVHLNSDWEISTNGSFTDVAKWSTASGTDKTTWRATGLEASSQYFIRVRHRSELDGVSWESPWSATVSFTTRASFAPAKPSITFPKTGATDVTASVGITSTPFGATNDQDVHLNSDWEISGNSSFTNIIQSNYGSASSKSLWQVTGLKSLVQFFIRVRHRSQNDGIQYVSDWSNSSNFTVAHIAPATPHILYPSNGGSNIPGSFTMTSSEFLAGEDGETHFSSTWQISESADFKNPVQSANASATAKTSWSVTDLGTDTTYYARVKHTSSLGFDSEWSPSVSFTTKPAAIAVAPSIIVPSSGSTTVDPASGFKSSAFSTSDPADTHVSSNWELSTDSSFSLLSGSVNNSTSNKTAWTPPSMTSGTTYYVRVKYKGSQSGDTPWSDPVSFKTKTPVLVESGSITTPSITSPTDGATDQSTVVIISASQFSSSAAGESHLSSDWELSTGSNFGTLFKSANGDINNLTSWSVTGLSTGTTYYVRVKYKGSKGSVSGRSAVSSFKTRSVIAAGEVTKPSITSPSNNSTGLNLSFTATSSSFSSTVSGETHFSSDWEVSSNSTFSAVVSSVTSDRSNKTSWTPTNLSGDTAYFMRVRYNGSGGGISQWSDTLSFRTKVGTATGGGGGIAPVDVTVTTTSMVRNNDTFMVSSPNCDAFHLLPTPHQEDTAYDVHGYFYKLSNADFVGQGYNVRASGHALESFMTRVTDAVVSSDTSKSLLVRWVTTTIATLANVSSFLSYSNNSVSELTTGPIPENSPYPTGYIYDVTADYSLKKFIIKTDGGVYNGTFITSDSGQDIFSIKGLINPPPDSLPVGWGFRLLLSGDGNILFILATTKIYIYQANGTDWTFIEKITLSTGSDFGSGFNRWDTTTTGDVLIVGCSLGTPLSDNVVKIFTRNGSSWSKVQVITKPNDVAGSGDQYGRGTWVGITGNGSIISLSQTGTKPSLFLYTKDANGDYSNLFKTIFLDLPVLGGGMKVNPDTSWKQGLHFLAKDGSRMVFAKPSYTIVNTSGDTSWVDGDICMATILYASVASSMLSIANITTPAITYPVANTQVSATALTFTSSPFSSSDVSETHANSDWEVATVPDGVVVSSSYMTSDKTSWQTNLSVDTQYNVRVRHRSSTGNESDWSPGIGFKTWFY